MARHESQDSDPGLPRLAPSELSLMKVLWAEGRLSAREVHERSVKRTGWAYSTTRTILQRLVAKGYVAARSFHGLNLFEASLSRAAGLAGWVKEFAQLILETGHAPVLSLLGEAGNLTEEEISELETLLESAEEGRE